MQPMGFKPMVSVHHSPVHNNQPEKQMPSPEGLGICGLSLGFSRDLGSERRWHRHGDGKRGGTLCVPSSAGQGQALAVVNVAGRGTGGNVNSEVCRSRAGRADSVASQRSGVTKTTAESECECHDEESKVNIKSKTLKQSLQHKGFSPCSPLMVDKSARPNR